MGPYNRSDGMHPDTVINDFKVLCNITQDRKLRIAIYSGMRKCINHNVPGMTYILDEQFHGMELCIYHGIKVLVEGLDCKRISLMC